MAKHISINLDHAFTSRGESETVKEALAWVEKHVTSEDEEGESIPAFTPGDLLVYAVRRLRALHKDAKRYDAGRLASRLYAPRLDNVEHAPKALTVAVASIDAVSERLAKPAPKAPAVRKAGTPFKAQSRKVKA